MGARVGEVSRRRFRGIGFQVDETPQFVILVAKNLGENAVALGSRRRSSDR